MINNLLRRYNKKLNLKKCQFCLLALIIIVATVIVMISILSQKRNTEIQEAAEHQVIQADNRIKHMVNLEEIIIIPRNIPMVASASVEAEVEVVEDSASRLEEPLTEEELEILHTIVEAEATGGTIEDKKNVTHVIINRMLSESFPDDVESIVFQEKQFAPIRDGRYYEVTVTEETVVAVEQALIEEDSTEGALFFCLFDNVAKESTKGWFKTLNYIFTDELGHSYYN